MPRARSGRPPSSDEEDFIDAEEEFRDSLGRKKTRTVRIMQRGLHDSGAALDLPRRKKQKTGGSKARGDPRTAGLHEAGRAADAGRAAEGSTQASHPAGGGPDGLGGTDPEDQYNPYEYGGDYEEDVTMHIPGRTKKRGKVSPPGRP